MSIIGSNILVGASGAEAAYTIDQSMYYGDTPSYGPKFYRQFDQTGSSTMKWTYATWWKKGPPHTNSKTVYYIRPLAISAGADVQLEIANDLQHNAPGFIWQSWAAGGGQATWYWATKDELILKDYSAWYHICHVVDYTTSPYVFLYLDGVLMDPDVIYTNNKTGAGYGAGWGAQSGDTFHVGSNYSTQIANAYLADSYWIEQQALNPVGTFGEFNEDTGQFVPIEYTGTYSGNSFYMDYADSADFGTDRSGLGNDFTVENIAAVNQRLDSPTNNFPTLNPLAVEPDNIGLSEGCLVGSGITTDIRVVTATMGAPDSGKWYWETLGLSSDLSRNGPGITTGPFDSIDRSSWADAGTLFWFYDGDIFMEDALISGGPSSTTGDILGFALDVDAKTLGLYVNNVLGKTVDLLGKFLTEPSIFPAINLYTQSSVIGKFAENFGQDSSFAGEKTAQGNQDGNGKGDFYYAPPTDYLALCTNNLPDPAIALPEDNFNIVLWTGDASSPSPTRAVGFQPDFVWYKQRSGTEGQSLYDSIRGVQMRLQSSEINTQSTRSEGLLSFESTGFTTGNDSEGNGSGSTYVGWTWKGGGATVTNTDGDIESEVSANPTAGFSILSYVGNATTSQTIGHGLSVTPELIIVKRYSGSYAWHVFPTESVTSANYDLVLNDTAAESSNTGDFGAYPTASVFTVQDGAACNDSGSDFIAYLFHSVEGYSKVGIYEGNGDEDGAFIYTGFRPAFVMTKSIDSTSDWQMFDDKRIGINPRNNVFEANLNAAPGTTSDWMDLVSNGFKNRIATDPNVAETYMYLAFAATPFKTSNAR